MEIEELLALADKRYKEGSPGAARALYLEALAQSRAEAEAAKELRDTADLFLEAQKMISEDLREEVGALTAELEKLRGMVPSPDEIEAGIEWAKTFEQTVNVGPVEVSGQDSHLESTAGMLVRLLTAMLPPANQSHQAATPECGCGMPPNMRVCLGPHNDAPTERQAATQDPAPGVGEIGCPCGLSSHHSSCNIRPPCREFQGGRGLLGLPLQCCRDCGHDEGCHTQHPASTEQQ